MTATTHEAPASVATAADRPGVRRRPAGQDAGRRGGPAPPAQRSRRRAQATAHRDACTRNLLVSDTDHRLTMIDFGFWGTAPVGFDLGQLLRGEVQLGNRRPASCPSWSTPACAPTSRPLHDEGDHSTLSQVRRSHTLPMTIYHAVPAIPYEHRAATPTPQLQQLYTQRAATARFILDLLDSTGS